MPHLALTHPRRLGSLHIVSLTQYSSHPRRLGSPHIVSYIIPHHDRLPCLNLHVRQGQLEEGRLGLAHHLQAGSSRQGSGWAEGSRGEGEGLEGGWGEGLKRGPACMGPPPPAPSIIEEGTCRAPPPSPHSSISKEGSCMDRPPPAPSISKEGS